MALTSCPECQKEISTKADMCPHCGYNLRREDTRRGILGLLAILIFAFVVTFGVMAVVEFFAD